MMPIVLRIIPVEGQWHEVPANAEALDSFTIRELAPIDLLWREAWVEAFLAENAGAVAACLGYGTPSAVFRQIADMDLAFVDAPSKTVVVLEVKNQSGDHATEAVCQLARNLERAERALHVTYPGYGIRPVACGSWSAAQVKRAQDTNAWHHLQEHSKDPTFALYSGARSIHGGEYFVLGEGTAPFNRRGKRASNESFEQLERHAREISEQLLPGLGITSYQVGGRAILRFTAGSLLRDKHLRAVHGSRPPEAVEAFFRVEASLVGSPDLFVRSFMGQRLEIFLQAKAEDCSFTALHEALAQIHRQAGRSSPEPAA